MDTSNENVSEEEWIRAQRSQVEDYLRAQSVDHRGVGEYPAFHVHPYVALWAIQSKKSPGQVGWWAISGDVPTDYVSSLDCGHPREALRAIVKRWVEVSTYMLRGERHPSFRIANPDQWPELADLLRRRAEILREYTEDNELWHD